MKTLSINLLLLVLAGVVAADDNGPALLDRVVFEPPLNWEETWSQDSDTLIQRAYQIPFRLSDTAMRYGTGVFVLRDLPPGADTSMISPMLDARDLEQFEIQNACSENRHWQAFLWTGVDQRGVGGGMERIGIANEAMVQVIVSFPLTDLEEATATNAVQSLTLASNCEANDLSRGGLTVPSALWPLVSGFNVICKTLDLDDTSEFKASFQLQ